MKKKKVKNAAKKKNKIRRKKQSKAKTKVRSLRNKKLRKTVSKKKSRQSASRRKKPASVIVTNIKTSRAMRAALIIRAKRFANGNLSLWLRYAGTRYTPKAREVVR